MNNKTNEEKTGFDAFDVAMEIIGELAGIIRVLQRMDDSLAKQVRRAGSSIGLNIAEGNRRTGKDRKYHFRIAAGSANEVRAALKIAVS